MFRRINTLKDVVDWELCIGCGACYYACGKGNISLINIDSIGIRPQFNSPECGSCTDCLSICPAYHVDASLKVPQTSRATRAEQEFGPALEIWEGYAQDTEVRYKASSGGILSALAIFCLEQEGMEFVLHTGVDSEQPWINRTVKSTNRDEILTRTGSRYAPSSPCDGLQGIEDSTSKCVFIGKPCDVAAVGMLRKQNPRLDEQLGLVLTFFCAGTPSTQGTLDLLTSLDVTPAEVDTVRYRGEGWPGRFKVLFSGGDEGPSLSYEDSWKQLTSYRPLRCNLCPDGLGRIADISCGDAWERHAGDGNPGLSIVIVRTERGREILRRAIAAKYVEVRRVDSNAVYAAQPNLLQRRRELFGRLLAMRLLGVPAPLFKGFSLFNGWIKQPVRLQLRSVLGTLRRIVLRRWWMRRPVINGKQLRSSPMVRP